MLCDKWDGEKKIDHEDEVDDIEKRVEAAVQLVCQRPRNMEFLHCLGRLSGHQLFEQKVKERGRGKYGQEDVKFFGQEVLPYHGFLF